MAVLGVSLRIEYMYRTAASVGGWHHDFWPEDSGAAGEQKMPAVQLLYRHDHYDLLYLPAPAGSSH